MEKPLRVLFVEDTEEDMLLVLRALRKGGYAPITRRVETASDMRRALEQKWDLVVSDYSLPTFSAPDALRVLRETGSDIPFIIASGTVGESVAVTALKAGA